MIVSLIDFGVRTACIAAYYAEPSVSAPIACVLRHALKRFSDGLSDYVRIRFLPEAAKTYATAWNTRKAV
ncbi:hypothetical protein [Neisseria sp.]|uniref:hypothetical protein n=1 Tax=Neisseria sp. TaxID=192066 RepID=UPI00359FA3B4